MRPNLTQYRVRLSERDIPVLLDMLCYEGATVRNWEHATIRERPAYLITIESRSYTPDRWASFLVYTEVI